MNSPAIKCLFGALLFIIAGAIGYHLFPLPDSAGKGSVDHHVAKVSSPVDPSVKAVQQKDKAPEVETVKSEKIVTESKAENETVSEPEPEAAKPDPLRYRSFQSQDGTGDLQACLEFDASFEKTKESALKPFLRITPEIPFSLDARGRRICLLGLDSGRSYEIKILKGLTADNNSELPSNLDVAITFEDKPAYVGFVGDGIILPETKNARVVLKTVNVDKLTLKLFRVNDRILSQHSPDIGESGTATDYIRTYEASNRRTEVWSGELDIAVDKNEIVETPFDLQGKIEDQGLGAFILIAEYIVEGDRPYRRAKAIRWLISTDMALSSYHGADALHLSVRSIKSAKLKAGVRLDLIAANNEKLAEVLTDGDGRAVFDQALLSGTGPEEPRMIMAYGSDGDYAVLDLSRAPLDLSTMDVQGREVGGAFDLYAFTDRGIYRPGETVQLTSLLRDNDAHAIEGRILTLSVKRPDNSELEKRSLKDDNMGGYIETIKLPAQAARGQWTFDIEVEGTETKIETTISVEDFVPQRLKLTLAPEDQPILKADEVREITLDAQFYYGAPGSNLSTEAEIRVQRDPNPFPEYKPYSFGDVTETFKERNVSVKLPITDDNGKAVAKIRLSKTDVESSAPLRASFIAGVAKPGGRFVRENVFIPVRSQANYVGFKSAFGERAERNKPAKIDLVALSPQGERVASKVTWSLIREQSRYSWYRYRSSWQYRNRTTDLLIADGSMEIEANLPSTWAKSLNWGRYRLDVKTDTGETASYRFGVGWSNWGESDSDAPDRVLVGATNLPTTPGGMMTLNLKAPYAGRGDIVIADHIVRSIRSVDIPEGASSVRIPYDPDWGHDIYAMVTLYTELDEKKRQGVKRAVGLTHIALDRSPQTLNVSFDIPERVTPRTKLDIPITLSGDAALQTAWVSLAAIDEGILALTDFDSPDAAAAFFAKKAFSLDVHDDYSRLLNPFQADGPTRNGGDSIGGAGLSVVPTKTVALFEGPVSVKNGKAVVTLNLPDFNGELRIMATAWTKDAIGSASQPLKVRDAVPANLALPRFLAPGDQAVATLTLDNIDGATGNYSANVDGGSLLESSRSVFALPPGTRDQKGFELNADDIGIYELTTDIRGPKAYSVQSEYPIEVRSPYRPVTRRILKSLEAGESYTLSEALVDGYSQTGADINLSVSRLPGLAIAPYLASLNRYPYGCTEQTVSKAMPLLFIEQLGGLRDTPNFEIRNRIQVAIERVNSRQSVTGEFGLWRLGDGYLAPWLQLYVAEFLVEADRKGFDVSASNLDAAINTARIISKMDRNTSLKLSYSTAETRKAGELRRAERAAYANYILALADKPDASAIRYLDKTFGDKLSDPISLSYLGAALARIGDEDKASVIFSRAYDRISESRTFRYYSSPERNSAALLAIGGDGVAGEIAEKILLGLADLEPSKASTQEKSYIVRAIAKLGTNRDEVSAKASGLILTDNAASLIGTDLNKTLSIENTGKSRVYVTLDVTSTPTRPPEVISSGFSIEKTLYTFSGEVVTANKLTKGDRAIIHLKANASFTTDKMIVLADLLPAGLEIETLLTPSDSGKEGRFGFLGELSEFDMQEARDDRFIASDRRTRWSREKNVFSAAYIVRAVTPGSFAFPGAVIEDMYRPARVATSEHGALVISPSGDF